jgi:hypothetical protein
LGHKLSVRIAQRLHDGREVRAMRRCDALKRDCVEWMPVIKGMRKRRQDRRSLFGSWLSPHDLRRALGK